MREIKFRAWNQRGGTFFVDENFSVSSDGKTIFFQEGEAYDMPSEFIVQQFTGRKDKDGKEIYEGDIVYVTAPLLHDRPEWQERNGQYEVRWKNEASCFGVLLKEEDEILFWECPIDWWNTLEVVGNVCENPTLLKKI